MSTGSALKQGLRLTRRADSAVWILFLANLALAAVAGLPIYRGILRFTGHSLMSGQLLRGFSVDWLTDFTINSAGSFNRYALAIAYIGLLSILVNSVLSGGVLARFRQPELIPPSGGFFRDTARYAWRMVRLMIIGLVCYWLVLRFLYQGLNGLIDRWMRDVLEDRPVFWAHLAVGVLVIAGLIFVNLVMDYARVNLVLRDESSTIAAFLSSLGFSLRRLRKALIVYAVPALLGLALLGIYRLVVPWEFINTQLGGSGGWPYREPLMLALLFIGQQVVMLARYWFRVATWASEWSYYSSTR